MNTHTPLQTEAVAIIGMKGRFPGADDLEQFWHNLRNGVETIARFTPEELKAAGVDPTLLNVPGFVPAGAVLDGIGMFDANFFGFSARDAETMDPQQRLFLECSYECLEDAGYDSEKYPGSIGVFGGCDWSTYLYGIYAHIDKLGYLVDGMALAVGNDKDHLTTHVSYKLNLRGPSVAVQTACSTSLVAVCLATHSLQARECDMALAGGAAISIPQKKGYYFQPGSIVSPDGHCRAFDAEGQGTVVGSGIGVVALKRLSDAIADGDHIYAVIRGAALNNDGSAKVGYTAPSIAGQAEVIAMAQDAAGIDADTISYVEAHGTATALGDPIEVAALTQAFRRRTDRKAFCGIGSLKSNVGHMSSAAGVGALIKTALCLDRRELPPTLHFNRANPQIDFANSPFYVQDRLTPWQTNGHPRRAAVSSFGIGGTNAHVVLEEAPERAPSGPSRPVQVLTLSAKTTTALEAATKNLVDLLDRDPAISLADVAHTLHVGRRAFNQRLVVIVDGSTADAAEALRAQTATRVFTEPNARQRPVVFMFPGQGTQYVDMGRQLYREEPTFREHVDRCCDILKTPLALDLRDILYPSADAADAAERLKQTALTQPALFTIEYALAQLWMEWGIVPQAMIGHSIGEYTAACLAGVFSLEDALALVALRGALMGGMRPGAMLAVPMPESAVRPLLTTGISLASVNGPMQCVLSGPGEVIGALARQLEARGTATTALHTSHAFHSAMMEPALKPFTTRLEEMRLNVPRLPFISCVTGTWITADAAVSPAYWAKQLRQTVRFGDGVQALLQIKDGIALEVGPGRTLSTLAQLQPGSGSAPLWLSSLHAAHEQQPDMLVMQSSLARMWVSGAPVSWTGYARHESRQRVSLPTYAFDREFYWVGPSEDAPSPADATSQRSRDIADWCYAPTWSPARKSEAVKSPSPSGPSPARWMVLGDSSITDALVKRLLEAEADVSLVTFGEAFERTGPATFTVKANDRAGYEALLKELRSDGRVPTKIVHLGAVDDAATFDEAQERGCLSLTRLAQALEHQNITQAIELGVVSTGLYAVLGDERLSPAKATALGPCKVIPQEYSNLTVRIIDVDDDDAAKRASGSLVDRLIAELTTEPFQPAVAYRNGQRWIQRYEPMHLAAPEGEQSGLRSQGVYLITGGLGNIGLTLAECLARETQARLVLTGRSMPPPRAEWESHLAAHPSGTMSARLRMLMKIEEAGGELLIMQADASSRADMARVVDAAVERFGTLNGIVHGAGNTSAQAFFPINQADDDAAQAHFAPKAQGVAVLEEVVGEMRLDFCLLLSSLSAVLGGLGLAMYAGANAFLDAFAAQQNQAGRTRWISVNWDAWHFTEPGEAASAPTGVWSDAILPAEGQEAFLRILHHAPEQVVVSTSSLAERIDKWITLRSLRETARAAGGGKLHARPPLSTQFVAPQTETEERVADIWQQLLGIGPIGTHDKFFELGGHSLLAIQVISRLRETFGVELPVQRLFEAPTVVQLSEAIERMLKAAPEEALEATGDDKLQDMLALVEGLSDDEVAAMLAKELRQTGAHDHEPHDVADHPAVS